MRAKASLAVAEARCCSWKGMGQVHWVCQSRSRRSFRAVHIPALEDSQYMSLRNASTVLAYLVDPYGSGRLGSGNMKHPIQLVLLVHRSASWADAEVGRSAALAAETLAALGVPL